MSTGEKVVLSIDPGSSKCGMVLVRRPDSGKLEVLWRAVSPSGDVARLALEAQTLAPYSMVIVGSGTRSRPIVQELREAMPSIGILVVDERDTSIQARERYWEHNPRRGWRRLFPASMQVPPQPVDDFVALILAERVLTDS